MSLCWLSSRPSRRFWTVEGNWQFSPLPHNEERQVYESWLPSLMRLIMCIYFSSVFIFVSCVLCLWIISKVKHLLWYVFNSGGPRRLAIYLPIILTCLYEFWNVAPTVHFRGFLLLQAIAWYLYFLCVSMSGWRTQLIPYEYFFKQVNRLYNLQVHS